MTNPTFTTERPTTFTVDPQAPLRVAADHFEFSRAARTGDVMAAELWLATQGMQVIDARTRAGDRWFVVDPGEGKPPRSRWLLIVAEGETRERAIAAAVQALRGSGAASLESQAPAEPPLMEGCD